MKKAYILRLVTGRLKRTSKPRGTGVYGKTYHLGVRKGTMTYTIKKEEDEGKERKKERKETCAKESNSF
jgi:hypothetical protein